MRKTPEKDGFKTKFVGAKIAMFMFALKNIKIKKSTNYFAILSCLCLCVFLLGCKKSKLPICELAIERADGVFVTVQAEVAKEEEERNYGFMNRKNIPDGTGMLFVFDRDQILSFWMKNTPHPLSIAYIDSHGVIKNIFDMTPYSLASIQSTVSVRYALEVPQGWFEKAEIKVGDVVHVH